MSADPAAILTIHRAAHEIGGNCIEVRCGDERIVLDVGRPLNAPNDATGLLPATLDLSTPATVIISHPHQDHYGLLDETPVDWPVHCGEPTRRLMEVTAKLSGRVYSHAVTTWKSGVRFELGKFAITPILTDHSAFDAHMVLIDVGGKTLLYSGDFRRHGRKAALVERLMRAPPEVDVLLLEGTNLGSDKPCVTEADVERDFEDLFRETPVRVFVAWSAQNVDRTVSIYRACLRAGRTLVVDLYTAEIMEMLAGFGRLPAPGWSQIKVLITAGARRRYRSDEGEAFVSRIIEHGMSASALQTTRERLAIMTRRSLIRDYARKDVAPCADDAWSWSQWRGYLANEDGAAVRDWFETNGARAVHIHTSGHASTADLRAFAQAIAPKALVPIHGVKWDEAQAGFPPIKRLQDGEPYPLA